MSSTNVRLIPGGSGTTTMDAVDKVMERAMKHLRDTRSRSFAGVASSATVFVFEGEPGFKLRINGLETGPAKEETAS